MIWNVCEREGGKEGGKNGGRFGVNIYSIPEKFHGLMVRNSDFQRDTEGPVWPTQCYSPV